MPMYSIGAIGATFLMGKEKKVTKSAPKKPTRKKLPTQKVVHIPIQTITVKKPIVHPPIVHPIEPPVKIHPQPPVKVHPIIKKLKEEGITNIYTRTTTPTMLERKDLTKQEKIEKTVKIIETMKPENQDKFTNAVVSNIIQTDPITQVAVETVIQKRLNLLRTAGFQFGGR